MLKKTITYEDFNGNTVSEEFFFHLSKAELVEIEMSHEGGLSASLARIVAAEDAKSIIAEFKNILLSAYGKRSEDGRRFIKNQELRDEFMSSEAYSTLFMELVTNTDAAIEFIRGIIPADMAKEAVELVEENRQALKAVSEPRIVTKAEVLEMSADEVEKLSSGLASGEIKLAE